jgi:hypothetical protein
MRTHTTISITAREEDLSLAGELARILRHCLGGRLEEAKVTIKSGVASVHAVVENGPDVKYQGTVASDPRDALETICAKMVEMSGPAPARQR